MNQTLVHLALSSSFRSPLFTMSHTSMSHNYFIGNSRFSKFFNPAFQSYTNKVKASFISTTFNKFLGTPLRFEQDFIFPIIGEIIGQPLPIPHESNESILIKHCIFNETTATGDYGGAIFSASPLPIEIESTTFSKCYASTKGGAIYFNNGKLNASIKFCCFSMCSISPDSELKNEEPQGSAIFSNASYSVVIRYGSTNNCPGTEKPVSGGQFDLKASYLATTNINSSQGNSRWCSAIEFRYAKAGEFKYQTLVDHSGCFVLAFTGLEALGVTISHCNIVGMKFSRQSDVSPAAVVAQGCVVNVSDFYFYDLSNPLNEADYFLIITRPNKEIQGSKEEEVFLMNSITDSTEDHNTTNDYPGKVNIIDVEFDVNQSVNPTPLLSQLNLDECQGIVPPPPLNPTTPVSQDIVDSSEFARIDSSEIEIESSTLMEESSDHFAVSSDVLDIADSSIHIKDEKTSEITPTNEAPTDTIKIKTPTDKIEIQTQTNGNEGQVSGGGDGDDKLKIPELIGIIVGVVAAVAIIAAVSIILVRHSKNKRLQLSDSGKELEIVNSKNGIFGEEDKMFEHDFDEAKSPIANRF